MNQATAPSLHRLQLTAEAVQLRVALGHLFVHRPAAGAAAVQGINRSIKLGKIQDPDANIDVEIHRNPI